MSFFRSAKMWKSQGENLGWTEDVEIFPNLWSLTLTRLRVRGQALLCQRITPFDSVPGRSDFMARSSTLSHQETNQTSLHFFAWLHFQCWTNTLYTTLTSRAIMKQLCGPVRFHYACLLPYRWQYRYVTTVLLTFARNVFYVGCTVFMWLPLIVRTPPGLINPNAHRLDACRESTDYIPKH